MSFVKTGCLPATIPRRLPFSIAARRGRRITSRRSLHCDRAITRVGCPCSSASLVASRHDGRRHAHVVACSRGHSLRFWGPPAEDFPPPTTIAAWLPSAARRHLVAISADSGSIHVSRHEQGLAGQLISTRSVEIRARPPRRPLGLRSSGLAAVGVAARTHPPPFLQRHGMFSPRSATFRDQVADFGRCRSASRRSDLLEHFLSLPSPIIGIRRPGALGRRDGEEALRLLDTLGTSSRRCMPLERGGHVHAIAGPAPKSSVPPRIRSHS